MSDFLNGIGALVGKLSTYLPGRIAGLKDERERLLNEKSILMSKDCSASASRRLAVIDDRLHKINAILINNAKD